MMIPFEEVVSGDRAGRPGLRSDTMQHCRWPEDYL
jgi:hypothetical protein